MSGIPHSVGQFYSTFITLSALLVTDSFYAYLLIKDIMITKIILHSIYLQEIRMHLHNTYLKKFSCTIKKII